jgi:hypothetical protein
MTNPRPPYAELMFAPVSRTENRYALPAGASRGAVVYAGTLNRAPVWFQGGRVLPPERWDWSREATATLDQALDACAAVLLHGKANGLGKGVPDVFVDLEGPGVTLADNLAVAQGLVRRGLKRVWLYGWPQWNRDHPDWAKMAEYVVGPCYCCYAGDNEAAGDFSGWHEYVRAEAEWVASRFKGWRKRERVAFVNCTWQTYSDAALINTPLPLDEWGKMLNTLEEAGWTPFLWGPPVPGTEPHVALLAERWGLAVPQTTVDVPAVVVPVEGAQ